MNSWTVLVLPQKLTSKKFLIFTVGGYSHLRPMKMNGTPGFAALQMPANNDSSSAALRYYSFQSCICFRIFYIYSTKNLWRGTFPQIIRSYNLHNNLPIGQSAEWWGVIVNEFMMSYYIRWTSSCQYKNLDQLDHSPINSHHGDVFYPL